MKLTMLSFLIVLYVLIGVQGKAFPNRYKRNNEDGYYYIPVENGIVQVPARYSPNYLPNYEDYKHEYVQTNEYDWSAYYHQPMVPQQMQNPYSKTNELHKIKSKHTWHFIDQNHAPITQYMDGNHVESHLEVPNGVEPLDRNEFADVQDTAYDIPIVVEALAKKDDNDHKNAETFEIVDSLTIKEKPIEYGSDENPTGIESTIKRQAVHEVENKASNLDLMEEKVSYDAYDPVKIKPVAVYNTFELPVMDSLDEKDKPIEIEPSTFYYKEKPIKEKPIKPIKEKPIKPIKEKPIKPIKEKPIKDVSFISSNEYELPVVVASLGKNKSVKVKPSTTHMHKPTEMSIKDDVVIFHDTPNYPVGFDSSYEIKETEYETPIIIEALIRKEKPTLHADEEFESPVVVEALIRKSPVYENKNTSSEEDEILPKDLIYPVKEPILIKEDVGSLDNPVVKVLDFEQDDYGNESSEEESITLDETRGFNEADMETFDENGDHGSAMIFDRSHSVRSFLPVNSDIFSTVKNIKEQEKLKFKSCVTPKNETGNCMPFQLCSVLSAISNIDELLRNVCLIDEVFIGVCCPEFPVETVRVDWEQLKPDKEILNKEKSQISKECGRLPSTVTDRDSWPWMASLIAKTSNKIFCGGALVNEQYVLTAAHCTIRIPRNQILVRLGRPASENRFEPDFEVIEIRRHAGYNPRTMENDIALLQLSRRVQLEDFRSAICLPKERTNTGESASLLRWKETPGEIKDVESLLVISSRECQSRMRTAISDSILCSEPRTDETMCNADSGAPLIIAKDDKFEVIGILTWNRNDCDERFPTVFTRVSSYRRWIEKLAS